MTPDRLANIRARAERFAAKLNDARRPALELPASMSAADVPDLLAEVERLTAELATQRAATAYRIRAELVCCDVYQQDHDTDRAGTRHAICFWGEAAAQIAETITADGLGFVADTDATVTGLRVTSDGGQNYWLTIPLAEPVHVSAGRAYVVRDGDPPTIEPTEGDTAVADQPARPSPLPESMMEPVRFDFEADHAAAPEPCADHTGETGWLSPVEAAHLRADVAQLQATVQNLMDHLRTSEAKLAAVALERDELLNHLEYAPVTVQRLARERDQAREGVAELAAERDAARAERDEARRVIRNAHQAIRDNTTAGAVALAMFDTRDQHGPSLLDEVAHLRELEELRRTVNVPADNARTALLAAAVAAVREAEPGYDDGFDDLADAVRRLAAERYALRSTVRRLVAERDTLRPVAEAAKTWRAGLLLVSATVPERKANDELRTKNRMALQDAVDEWQSTQPPKEQPECPS